MWSCMACAATMMLRMYCALSGTSSCSAFSTARTEAIACTVVQTPQNRCVNSHASRGSRPCRIRSMPRNIWPDDHAFRTTPPSTSASMRRCPSMRVTGSMVIRDMSLLQCEDREDLDHDDVEHQLAGDEPHRREDLDDAREIRPVRPRLERDQVGIEAVERAGHHEQHRHAEQSSEAPAALTDEEHEDGDDGQGELEQHQDAIQIEREERRELAASGEVIEPQPDVGDGHRNHRAAKPRQHVAVRFALEQPC